MSQPAAPHAAVAIPKTTKGSKPITCAPMCSKSCVERTWTPMTVLAMDETIEEASEYLRREARSLKNEFQSSLEASCRDASEIVELARKETVRWRVKEEGIWGRADVFKVSALVRKALI